MHQKKGKQSKFLWWLFVYLNVLKLYPKVLTNRSFSDLVIRRFLEKYFCPNPESKKVLKKNLNPEFYTIEIWNLLYENKISENVFSSTILQKLALNI